MIAQDPVWPAAGWQRGLVFVDHSRDLTCAPLRAEQSEIERQMDTGEITTIIGNQAFERQIYFSDQHARVEFIDDAAQLGDNIMNLGQVGGIERQQALALGLARPPIQVDRIISKLFILQQLPDHVDPKPVNAAPKPKPRHVVDGPAHVPIAPIEIGLLG